MAVHGSTKSNLQYPQDRMRLSFRQTFSTMTSVQSLLGAKCVFTALIFITALLIFSSVGNSPRSIYPHKSSKDVIPNNVHYVYVMKTPTSGFSFKFQHYLSIYSVSLYLKPDIIYFHTDAAEDSIQRAREDTENKWNRLVFNMPLLKINRVVAPRKTGTTHKAITSLEHRSDFVRVKMVYELGGVYLDWDAHLLRDIRALLNTGFNNVVGREDNGKVQAGTFMSKKGTKLLRYWMDAQPVVYDGGWITHANKLITKIADHLVQIPGEVLIMEQRAFTPGNWDDDLINKLYEPHLEVPAASLNETIVEDELTDRWDHTEAFHDWEVDYSSTYVIHAFDHKRHGHGPVPNFDGISARYILARQSNFARAVYPAVRHMLDAGVISVND